LANVTQVRILLPSFNDGAVEFFRSVTEVLVSERSRRARMAVICLV